jgi:hypothetical protein
MFALVDAPVGKTRERCARVCLLLFVLSAPIFFNGRTPWLCLIQLLVLAGASAYIAKVARTVQDGEHVVEMLGTDRSDVQGTENSGPPAAAAAEGGLALELLPSLAFPMWVWCAPFVGYFALCLINISFTAAYAWPIGRGCHNDNEDGNCTCPIGSIAIEAFIAVFAQALLVTVAIAQKRHHGAAVAQSRLAGIVEDVSYAKHVLEAKTSRTVRWARRLAIVTISTLPLLYPALDFPRHAPAVNNQLGQFINYCPEGGGRLLWALSTAVCMASVFTVLYAFEVVSLAYRDEELKREELATALANVHNLQDLRGWVLLRKCLLETTGPLVFDQCGRLVALAMVMGLALTSWFIAYPFVGAGNVKGFANTMSVFLIVLMAAFMTGLIWILASMVAVSKSQSLHAALLRKHLMMLQLTNAADDAFLSACKQTITVFEQHDTYPHVLGIPVRPQLLTVVKGYVAAAVTSAAYHIMSKV